MVSSSPLPSVPTAVTSDAALEAALRASSSRLLTVDVWDTLIRRTRGNAAAKLATARRMLLSHPIQVRGRTVDDLYQQRVHIEWVMSGHGATENYEAEQVLTEQLRALGVAEADVSAARLYRQEVEEEAREVRVASAALAGLPEWWTGHLAMVSDFYLRADSLREVVVAAAPAWADVPLLVSCERGVSKRVDGKLHDLVRTEFGVGAEDHLHVGDSVVADVEAQERHGGRAVLVDWSPKQGVPPPPRPEDWVTSALMELEGDLSALAAPTESYQAGVDTAVLAVALVARAAEEAVRAGVSSVCFVSREGRFLMDVWEACADALALPRPIRPIWLEVSRRASFAPSLEEPFRFSLRRMWTLYDKQSPRAMLVSCGLDPEEFVDVVADAGLDMDRKVTNIPRDTRVLGLLDAGPVRDALARRVAEQRQELRRYLAERGALDEETLVVVDIGWRGTIQDNIAHVIPEHFLRGVYLGLFGFLNDQPANTSKVAVAFDCNQEDDADFVVIPAVIERPWTPDIPSAIGFVPEGRDGSTLLQREGERGSVTARITDFQQGVMAAAPAVARWITRNGLADAALHALCHAVIEAAYRNPTRGLAAIWFESDHDDTFGALTTKSDDARERGTAPDEDAEWPEGFRAWRGDDE